MPIPVYLFTGFLDSGKTKLMQETMEDEGFCTGEKTLVLMCEDGDEELNSKKFAAGDVKIVSVENEQDLTESFFKAIAKEFRFDRVLIEYNGMWKLETLYNAMPEHWQIFQIITLANAEDFPSHFTNLRELTIDKLQDPEVVIFNRVSDATDKVKLHKSVRMVNRRAAIIYERTDGSIDDEQVVIPLPFDKNADVINIEDEDFAQWYLDVMDHLNEYIGKKIRFKACVCQTPRVPKGCFVPGRFAMTCCADDITFIGFICEAKDAQKYESREWVTVTAKIDARTHPIYDGEGPWLIAESLEKAEKPKDELVYFIQ